MFTTTLGRITIVAIVTATFCIGLFLIAAWSVNDAIFSVPQLQITAFEAPGVQAKAFMIFDLETGTEIASHNSEEPLPIASVTKLLTASLFYEAPDLNATTSIAWSDVNTEGDAGKLHTYDLYTYRELLYPLLLESSNDAAAAMLRVQPDLLDRMNAYVGSLGLSHTHFGDTSGLSDENVSTAYELSVLGRMLYAKEPHIFDITRLSQFIGEHTGWMNNNPLVHEEGYRGGKHGFTYEANRTDIAFFNETLENGAVRTIGYVLLGTESVPADITVLREKVRQNVRFE